MKKRTMSILLTLVVLLTLAVPALAAGETEAPEYRLKSVDRGGDSMYAPVHFEYVYGNGGYLPTEVLRESAAYATAEYDSAGRLIHRQDGANAETYAYDDNGNRVQDDAEDLSFGELLSGTYEAYSYDSDGNLLQYDYTYTFTPDNRTETTSEKYTYDDMGRLLHTESTYKSGDQENTYTDEYVYDDATLKSSYTRCKNSEEIVITGEYIYDENWNKLSYTLYDKSGAVSSKGEYTYDENGNQLSYTRYDGNGQVTAVDTYDEMGNQLSFVRYDDSGEVTYAYEYTYDGEGRLLSTSYTSGTDTHLTEYIYTPLLVIEVYHTNASTAVRYNLQDATGAYVLPSVGGRDYDAGAEPEFVYDDNGYLVQYTIQGTTTEFTYEPVT